MDSKVHPKGRYVKVQERDREREKEKEREREGEGREEEGEGNLRPPVNSYRTSYRASARTRAPSYFLEHTHGQGTEHKKQREILYAAKFLARVDRSTTKRGNLAHGNEARFDPSKNELLGILLSIVSLNFDRYAGRYSIRNFLRN